MQRCFACTRRAWSTVCASTTWTAWRSRAGIAASCGAVVPSGSAGFSPFFVAAQFTGLTGKLVSLKETIEGFEEILSGKLDDLPEQAFYLVGNIEEAKEKARKLEAGA